jgi:hypothetical protein
MRKYTNEQLIFYLKKLASELKRSPTIKDMDKKKKYPSASTYSKRFGSWNNSLRKAALEINVRKKYQKKELIENLKLLAKEQGEIPKGVHLKNKKWTASYTTYRKYFGSWKKALKAAGLTKIDSFMNLKDFTRRKRT